MLDDRRGRSRARRSRSGTRPCCRFAPRPPRRRTRSGVPRTRTRRHRAERAGHRAPIRRARGSRRPDRAHRGNRAMCAGRRSCRRASSATARDGSWSDRAAAARSTSPRLAAAIGPERGVVGEAGGEPVEELGDLIVRARPERRESGEGGVDAAVASARVRRPGRAAARRCRARRRGDRPRRTAAASSPGTNVTRSPPNTIGCPAVRDRSCSIIDLETRLRTVSPHNDSAPRRQRPVVLPPTALGARLRGRRPDRRADGQLRLPDRRPRPPASACSSIRPTRSASCSTSRRATTCGSPGCWRRTTTPTTSAVR